MKAIKIDVVKKDIYEVTIDKNNGLKDIYKHIQCDLFCVPFIFENNDAVYVDDEGLLKSVDHIEGAFMLKDFHQPLFGHGLVIGHTDDGESTNIKTSIEELKASITFLSSKKEYLEAMKSVEFPYFLPF